MLTKVTRNDLDEQVKNELDGLETHIDSVEVKADQGLAENGAQDTKIAEIEADITTINDVIVKSVEGIFPDENGNVDLGATEAVVRSVNNQQPDGLGNVIVDDTNIPVINPYTGTQSMLNLTLTSIKDSTVRTVNSVPPNTEGNVDVDAYKKSESDSRYLKTSGGTVTGDVVFSGATIDFDNIPETTLSTGFVAYLDTDGTLYKQNLTNLNAGKLDGIDSAGFIQKPIKINAGSDLNNNKTPGMYFSSANADNVLNAPISGTSFSLLVEQHAGIKQTWTSYSTGEPKTFIRNFYQSWGPWKELYIMGLPSDEKVLYSHAGQSNAGFALNESIFNFDLISCGVASASNGTIDGFNYQNVLGSGGFTFQQITPHSSGHSLLVCTFKVDSTGKNVTPIYTYSRNYNMVSTGWTGWDGWFLREILGMRRIFPSGTTHSVIFSDVNEKWLREITLPSGEVIYQDAEEYLVTMAKKEKLLKEEKVI